MDYVAKDYITHHLRIIETRDTVENVCNTLTLCVFLANCIELCMLLYYTTLVSKQLFLYHLQLHKTVLWLNVFSHFPKHSSRRKSLPCLVITIATFYPKFFEIKRTPI